ncbi:MAG TPA: hypothetical protein ENJ82_16525 [Bacteroidetes bacterium]|nr:hypothetical protein [Bacteroidota bacterium]
MKSWFTKGAQAEAKEVENTAKKGKKAASLQNAGGKGRWLIAPVLEKGDYLTQAPPWLAQHKQTMSKEKLFRFALAKYGPSGTKDISNEEKVKKSWKNKSYQERLEKVYWIGCMNTCVSMLESVGASPDFSKAISTITEDLKSKNVKGNGNLKNGVSIIEKNLKGGKPVVMGVHKNFKRQNYDATDHFVVAVGIWQEGEKIAIAYFDPGTGRPSGWDVSKNLIWIDQKNKMAIDEKNYGSSQYILSRVTDNQ